MEKKKSRTVQIELTRKEADTISTVRAFIFIDPAYCNKKRLLEIYDVLAEIRRKYDEQYDKQLEEE